MNDAVPVRELRWDRDRAAKLFFYDSTFWFSLLCTGVNNLPGSHVFEN